MGSHPFLRQNNNIDRTINTFDRSYRIGIYSCEKQSDSQVLRRILIAYDIIKDVMKKSVSFGILNAFQALPDVTDVEYKITDVLICDNRKEMITMLNAQPSRVQECTDEPKSRNLSNLN